MEDEKTPQEPMGLEENQEETIIILQNSEKMKMPASVLESTFKEFVVASALTTTSMNVASRITPVPTPQLSLTKINIKPEHILVGTAGLLFVLWGLYEIKKSKEEKEKRILLANSQRRS